MKGVRIAILLTALSVPLWGFGRPPGEAARGDPGGPVYDEEGRLERPAGFREWVLAGSNLGLGYQQDGPGEETVGDFRNVYINPEAYAHFEKTGEFPQKTVFVIEVLEAKKRDGRGVVAKGYSPGGHRRLEVSVKNKDRPDGSETPWAYYVFGPGREAAAARKDRDCFDCHKEHASHDHVWVQFYPTLRDLAAATDD